MHQNTFTQNPTKPVDVKDRSIGELIDAMTHTGFQGRKLAESVHAWNNMLHEKNLTIFMGLTGAMVPAGMRKIILYLIENRLIDCLVSTGANIFHDCHEALGMKHYVGSHKADDRVLFENGIDRIYDVFAIEKEFRDTDNLIADFVQKLDDRPYSSREFIYLLGKEIEQLGGNEDSIIVSAYRNNIPIFIPALCDSSIGIGLAIARRENCNLKIIDQIKDVDEITQIVEKSEKTGVIYIGGGVPKNFIQQTEIVSSIMGIEGGGHDYAIQYTTDVPHWGGLSGCTFDEAVSWGKISTSAKKVQVFVDATIALPIVSHALFEKTKYLKRTYPIFNWTNGSGNSGLEINYI
ncbi:deoxyhypusine synthase [Methanosalsum zhilinae DSM 4017]|uniref:Probable deoxyhypusine synthase 2 n=1 Tax=Methanosalsum zhilinae (strain DSM 4017 / NBRC 107636 / OCM 62 / WeN5) TaxID=679901 RepID=F7XLR9_METZD|nr:deoxyhypusine synthase [Methanosalsum zhilinae]AEH60939.1 deoxyhypusine synthase [Methanosalsum zhilinae DSM 4017]